MAQIVFRDPFSPTTIMEHTVTETYFSQETPFQQVDFFRTKEFGMVLALGGVINVAEHAETGYHEMLAHVPMFAHPNPKRVLIIGGGDGGTLREVTRHPELEQCTLVEIDAVVIEQSKRYLPQTAVGFDHPKALTIVGDGLAHVREAADASYDIILVDSTDPVDAGVVLFTEEFYQECYRVLAPGGILVPQSDTMIYQPHRVTNIAQTLRKIFPRVDFYLTQVPVYPGCMWSFAFASKGVHPHENVDWARVERMEPELDYYHGALHRAAFVLPTCYRRLVEPA